YQAILDLERCSRYRRSASIWTRLTILDHEAPSGEILPIEKPLKAPVERHISHLIQVAFELFSTGRKTVLFEEIGDDIQVIGHTQIMCIVQLVRRHRPLHPGIQITDAIETPHE